MKKIFLYAALLTASLGGAGCTWVDSLGIHLFYRKANLPARQVIRDIPYSLQGNSDPAKRLDLYKAVGQGWPVIVFVHGGGWNTGDKDLTVGGADVYGNIGRFYASHGIGVAVINYRLVPTCRWEDQPEDVAQAIAWVKGHIADYGGDPKRIFLMGHSAGTQLITRVALDPGPLKRVGLAPSDLAGVIAVSGAGLDLEDVKTYQMEAKIAYYELRFREGTTGDGWRHEASPIRFTHAGASPFLILYAGGETKSLQRQSRLLNEALIKAGVDSRIVVVPGQSHERIVLTLSRPDKTAGPAILNFVLKKTLATTR